MGPGPRAPALFAGCRRFGAGLLLAILLPACGNGGSATLGPDDDGTSITVAVGDVVEVSLPSNPSTGYAWHLGEELNEEILQVQSSEYVPEEDSEETVGSGGTEVWRFLGAGPGSAAVALVYYFGDDPGQEANTFSFSATVE